MSRRMFAFISTLSLIFSIAGPAYASAPAASSAAPTSAAASRVGPKVQLEATDALQVVENPLKGASEGIFLIRLADAPLATYQGGVVGLQATSPLATGDRKLNAATPASVQYVDYVKAEQATFVSRMEKTIGHTADVRFTYTNGNNGLAVWMTPQEAARVAKLPGVAFVQPDEVRELQTDTGPSWIGAPSIWGGTDCSAPGSCGEGIVVGIIDTGINPLNPSFADIGGDGYDHTNPNGAGNYVGVCDPTNVGGGDIMPYDAAFPCNDKLIGAWGYASVDAASPLDYDGHGSHTASTAAGNFVTATLQAPAHADLDISISGVAPHANIIAYGACCTLSALTAAIDQAIADGVDVINYSIGSSSASDVWNDFDTVGYLNARAAGIFVATSAGNDGPDPATVGSPADAPWLTSVAASTHSREFPNTLESMTGGDTTPPADITGKGFTDGYGPAPIVYAGDFGDAQCLVPFAAGTWTAGEIVVCDRGQIARVDKGANVLAGGAGGFVLANDVANGDSLVGDAHVLPGVHISYNDGVVLEAWLASGTGHTATIGGATLDINPANGDIMADFSSRGPNRAIDIVSPHVSAPGVDIIAAAGTGGAIEWGFNSGTSMASPHVAGSGALLVQEHPTWTPAEIQSALMLTANTNMFKEDGVTPTDPFDMGNGRVDLATANAAGLIMSETAANYTNADPALGGDPTTLNLANMANSACVLGCSWTRTVKATADGSWTVTTTSDPNLGLTVSPTSFTLAAGATQELTITADVTTAPTDVWMFGEVSLTATGVPDSHMPVAVQATRGSLPSSVDISTRRDAGSEVVSGLTAIEITQLTIETAGLTLGTIDELSLDQDPTNGDPYDNLNDGTVAVATVDVPAGAWRLVAETFDSTAPDVDLYVGTGTTPSAATEVCFSATGSAAEYCNIDNPDAGTYWILVQNWETSGVTDSISLSYGVVTGDEGNMLIEGPAQQPQLDPFDIRILWNEPAMEAGDHLYGAFTVGTDGANPGNVGTVPVNLVREADDVTKTVSSPTAEPGDTLTYTITVEPNPTATDIAYEVVDFIPDGLTYVPGSASGGLTLRSDGALTWSGVMPHAEDPFYSVTDSTTDAMCDTGFGGYVDLEGSGITADPSLVGDTVSFTAFTGQNPFQYFGQSYSGVTFSDDGSAYFGDGYGGTPWIPQAIPDPGLPNNVVGGFWHDFELFYDAATNRGVTLATAGPEVSIIEYDDLQPFGGGTPIMDMEIVLQSSVDDTPGFYEVVVAFDNVASTPTGTIGVENFDGTAAAVYLNNADSTGVISSGLQVCFDLTAPVAAPQVLTYQATVDPGTEGTIITNDVSHGVDSIGSATETSSVDVAIGDVTAPTDGANLWAEEVLSSSLTLKWDAATDDRGVTGYGIYRDGAHQADVAAGVTMSDVTGLTPSTAYDFTVKAMDAQGNESAGLMLAVTTAVDYTDDNFSIFENDIEWLNSAGITRGCNPPANDKYCPEDSLTRGQLAAMLSRALDLPAAATDFFTDDDGSVFENDINAVAAAGITLGCNPPANDNYCPDDLVTRGEMAAMMDRALVLPATATDFFTDDDGSIFEGSINRIAAANITRGCNPPTNDNYCPNDLVTRGQMAAFFHRALG